VEFNAPAPETPQSEPAMVNPLGVRSAARSATGVPSAFTTLNAPGVLTWLVRTGGSVTVISSLTGAGADSELLEEEPPPLLGAGGAGGAGGVGVAYVYPELNVELPAAVVTTTLTAPALPAGVTAVIALGLEAVTVAATPLNVTDVGEVRFQPPITTEVPPAVVPLEGVIVLVPGAVVVGARRTPEPHVLVVQSLPVPVGKGATADWICPST